MARASGMPLGESDRAIRVLCVDDHPLIRKGIASILANEPDMDLVAEASDGREAIRVYRESHPDVTLMDLRMPELDGIAATKAIREEFPAARIIALTSYEGDQDIYRALDAGVRGYLLKEAVHSDVLRAIRTVHAGKRLMPAEVAGRLTEYFPQMALTPRETEVLGLVANGLGNKEIAHELGVSVTTVRTHLNRIYEKKGPVSRVELALYAAQFDEVWM